MSKQDWRELEAYRALGKPEELCKKQGWISVKDRLPQEHDSIFARFYGTSKWDKHMFRKTSDECIVCCVCEDGKKRVTTSWTKDGAFCNPYDIAKVEVTHWQPLPKLPEEEASPC